MNNRATLNLYDYFDGADYFSVTTNPNNNLTITSSSVLQINGAWRNSTYNVAVQGNNGNGGTPLSFTVKEAAPPPLEIWGKYAYSEYPYPTAYHFGIGADTVTLNVDFLFDVKVHHLVQAVKTDYANNYPQFLSMDQYSKTVNLPGLAGTDQMYRVAVRGEDQYGNQADSCMAVFR